MNSDRFPKDIKTYGIDKQFLWGKSLLVTPVLDPGVDYVNGYFPEGLWFDFYTVRTRFSCWNNPEIKHKNVDLLLLLLLLLLLRVILCSAKVKRFNFTLL